MGEAEDKAEKLAAAKKKYEQLKKQKAKKGGATKKKDDAESSTPSAAAAEPAKDEPEDAEDDEAEEAIDTIESPRKSHGRAPSVSIQSKLRSESFRKESPLSPGAGDGDPAFKIEALEKDNRRLQDEKDEAEKRWKKLEEELQELKEEQSGGGDWLKQADGQANEVEKLKAEIASLQRQNTQLTAAKRKSSASISLPQPVNSADILAQLNSKTDTISSLELDISSIQSKLSALQSKTDEQESKLSSLELDLAKAIHDKESTAQELADLKTSLDKAGEDGSSAESRAAQLEAELGSARRAVDEATKRAKTLEKKVETLTTLHRESDARHQTKLADLGKSERDTKELRARVTSLSNENGRLTDEAIKRKKLEADGDADGVEELEDEERQRLASRVRGLEEEIFELRRGVWREKRMALQPGMDTSSDPYAAGTAFDDIDLATPSSRRPTAQQQQHSTISDVISSGLAAFRGDARRLSVPGRDRGQSLLSDDGFEFDEDAFRKAQEDEAGKRLERVREVKRGLVNWKGWRIDIADLRGGWGGVFEA